MKFTTAEVKQNTPFIYSGECVLFSSNNKFYCLSIQSAPVSFPTGSYQPSIMTHPTNRVDPAGMLPHGDMKGAAYHPVPAVSSHNNAPGTVLRDDLTQAKYTVPGHYQPHTTHESPHDHKDLFSHPGSIPVFGKLSISTQVSWCF